MMTSTFHHDGRRRERVAKGAFVIWMAAYTAIIIAFAVAHVATASTADTKGTRSLQARMTGQPQSSLIAPEIQGVVLIDDRG